MLIRDSELEHMKTANALTRQWYDVTGVCGYSVHCNVAMYICVLKTYLI